MSWPTTGKAAGARSPYRSVNRLRSARAGRPVKARVTTVPDEPGATSASRWAARVPASGVRQQGRPDLHGGRAGGEHGPHLLPGGQPTGDHQRDRDDRERRREECRRVRSLGCAATVCVPRWPPAVAACRHTASAPTASAATASSGLVALMTTRTPTSCSRWTTLRRRAAEVERHDRDRLGEQQRQLVLPVVGVVPVRLGQCQAVPLGLRAQGRGVALDLGPGRVGGVGGDEQVDAERARGQLAGAADPGAEVRHAQVGPGQLAQPTGLADRRRQLGRRGAAGHRCPDERPVQPGRSAIARPPRGPCCPPGAAQHHCRCISRARASVSEATWSTTARSAAASSAAPSKSIR